MKLYATNLRFLGDTKKQQDLDCCVHGTIVFEINGEVLSDDTQWCVSASAYRFLHTLFADHFAGYEQHMIPCCGHFMVPSEDGMKVLISGCSNGIDFDVIHENEDIIIRTEENKVYRVPFAEYKAAVLGYAKQVEGFYHQNPPRRFEDEFEKKGFAAFCNEWYGLMEKAQAPADGKSQ